MADPTPEQIRDHVCPYDGAHCWEFQNELDARRKQAETLGIRFRENMFVIQAKISLPNVQKLTKTDLIAHGIICG